MFRLHRLRHVDHWLIVASLGLVAIGISAIDAATEPAPGVGPVERQLVWTGIALAAMVVCAWLPYGWVERLAYVLFALTVPLLVAVFATEPINGAQRWLRFGPVGFQPAELAKLAFVAALARFLARHRHWNGLGLIAVASALAAPPMLLILKQPDLGTALLFVPVMMAMLLGASIRWRYLSLVIAVGAAVSPVAWSAMSSTQRARITGFLEQRDTGPRPRDGGYQLYQSKLMIALGGTTGSDDASDVHVPFDHTDFIFSVMAARWGLAGVSATFILFGVLLWRGLSIASGAQAPFARSAAIGIVTLLVTQGLINMAMTVGLVPITGVTLPFVSYGGSSLLTSFVAVGMLLRISDQQSLALPARQF